MEFGVTYSVDEDVCIYSCLVDVVQIAVPTLYSMLIDIMIRTEYQKNPKKDHGCCAGLLALSLARCP